VNLSEGHALMEGKPWGTEYLSIKQMLWSLMKM
jgi:hypothetical protein